MATQPQAPPTDPVAFLRAALIAIWTGFLQGIGLTLGYLLTMWLVGRF